MQTLETLRTIINHVKYKDWQFCILNKGDGFLIQLYWFDKDAITDKLEQQKSRKWYISPHSCDSEVVRSCFLAIRQAEEHELCERFLYKGQQVYNPHLDMNLMANFIDTKPFETRIGNYNPQLAIYNLRKNKLISTRFLSMCQAYDINDLYAFSRFTKLDILKFRNVGKNLLSELQTILEKYNIKLRD